MYTDAVFPLSASRSPVLVGGLTEHLSNNQRSCVDPFTTALNDKAARSLFEARSLWYDVQLERDSHSAPLEDESRNVGEDGKVKPQHSTLAPPKKPPITVPFVAAHELINLPSSGVSFDPVAFTMELLPEAIPPAHGSTKEVDGVFTLSFTLCYNDEPLTHKVAYHFLKGVRCATPLTSSGYLNEKVENYAECIHVFLPCPLEFPIGIGDVPLEAEIRCDVYHHQIPPPLHPEKFPSPGSSRAQVAFPFFSEGSSESEQSSSCCRKWRSWFNVFDPQSTRRITGPRFYPCRSLSDTNSTSERHNSSPSFSGQESISQDQVLSNLWEGQVTPIPWLDALSERCLQHYRSLKKQSDAMDTPAVGMWVFHPVPSVSLPVLHLEEASQLLERGAYGTTSSAELLGQAPHTDDVSRLVSSFSPWRDYALCNERSLALKKPSTEEGAQKMENFGENGWERGFSRGSGILGSPNVYEWQASRLGASVYVMLSESHVMPSPRERQRLSELAQLPPLPLQVSVYRRSAGGKGKEQKSGSGAFVPITASLSNEALRPDDVALLWRFRFFICRDSSYLLPFLQAVRWVADEHGAAKSSISGLMQQQRVAEQWIRAWKEISLADILACLSPSFRGVSAVRRFAVHHLSLHATNPEILCRFALPLLHAVRYDSPSHHELGRYLVQRCSSYQPSNEPSSSPSGLPQDLFSPGGLWPLCTSLYWSAVVEGALERSEVESKQLNKEEEGPAKSPFAHFLESLGGALRRDAPLFVSLLQQQRRLITCLTTFEKYLSARSSDRTTRMEKGKKALRKEMSGKEEDRKFGLWKLFHDTSVSEVPTSLHSTVTLGEQDELPSTSAEEKEDSIQSHQPSRGRTRRVAVTLPSHPEQVLKSVEWKDFYVFKSALKPMQVTFVGEATSQGAANDTVESPLLLPVILKAEDTRQDELVLSFIGIVDALLRQEGLDLHLTTYRVRPTSTTSSIIGLVPNAVTFESVKNDIRGYWRSHHPTTEEYEKALLRYIKSLAGYSVLTFVLGVGDRHLENILLTKDGRLLHIDFGFLFGNDPKPFAPPMKLSNEMIVALGGPQSSGFHRFQTYCCSAYHILRRNARLLLYMLSAFSDARGLSQLTRRLAVPVAKNVSCEVSLGNGSDAGEGISWELDSQPYLVEPFLQVQEKLRLDLTNTQATQFILTTIANSVGSLFAPMWDVALPVSTQAEKLAHLLQQFFNTLMKRNHHGAPVDPLHPHLCFHREVLIYREWAVIRQNFLEALQRLSSSGPNRFSWNEPRKLWRHSQEALGKWILSQVARLKSKDLDLRRDLFFFPTEDMMSRGGRCISPKETGSSSLSYDAQLLRDLAMKSSAAQHSEHVELLRETLENFNLLKQCTRADKRIRQEMELVTPFNAISPIVRELDHNDASCSPVQKRIKGTIIEITAKYQVKEGIKIKFPVVSIPKAAMEKLQRSYSRFGKEVDEKEYGNSNSKDEGKSSSESFFLHRAATVALRYEGSLATGSLQLCADTSFKQHLHAKGYHVMDLCASPINAYCGVPHESTFSRSSSSLASSEGEPIITESPNYFCSAFVDCDAYFGSLGSALRVSPEEIHALVNTSPACDQDPTPLLLTYDVPYDEDLVEHLFLKLEKDLLRARENKSANLIIDYVLVLPLWWATPFAVDKTIFMSTDGATSTTVVPVGLSGELQLSEVREGDRSVAEAAAKLIASRSAAEHQGYRIPYQWPQRLAATVGRGPQKLFPVTSTDQDGFLCWDAIFFDDSYRYFCTATHQWLRGVTATEVIALHTPLEQSSQGKSLLEQAISSFYGPSAMPPASKD